MKGICIRALALIMVGMTFEFSLIAQCSEEILSFWNFNNDDNSTTYDIIGENHGIGGVPPSESPNGIIGKSKYFDGTFISCVSFPNYPDYDWSESLSIALWCKYSTIPDEFKVMLGYDEEGKTHWWIGLEQNSGFPCFYLYDTLRTGGGVIANQNLSDNKWHFLVGSYDRASQSQRIYIDGLLVADSTRSYSSPFTANERMEMGSLQRFGTVEFIYTGFLDEVALFDRALSEEEVLQQYYKGLNSLNYCFDSAFAPVFISEPQLDADINIPYTYQVEAFGIPNPTFRMDTAPEGMTIDTLSGLIEWLPTVGGEFKVNIIATNSAGQANQNFTISVEGNCIDPGVLYFNFNEFYFGFIEDQYYGWLIEPFGSPALAKGIISESLSFNGTDQYGVLPSNESFDWTTEESFSIELWCKLQTSTPEIQVFIGRDQPGSTHWWVGTESDSRLPAFYLYDSNRQGIGLRGTREIYDDQWHHIVAVYDQDSEKIMLYTDGQPDASDNWSFSAGFEAEADIHIGNMHLNEEEKFFYHGLLDELIVYKRALSLEDIQIHYNSGLAGQTYCFGDLPSDIKTVNTDSQQVNIYPVPAKQVLNIEFDTPPEKDISIQLMNTLGMVVQSEQIIFNQTLKEMNIAAVPRGYYLIRIVMDNDQLIVKPLWIY